VKIRWAKGLELADPVDNHVYNFGRFRLSVSVITGRSWCVPEAFPVAFGVVLSDSISAGTVCAMAV